MVHHTTPAPLALTLLCALAPACGADDSASASATASTAVTTATTTTAATTDTATTNDESSSSSGASTSGATDASTTDASTTDGATTAVDSSSTSAATTDAATTDAATTDATTDTDSTTEAGMEGIPVHDIPGLLSITFWERSGGQGPTPYTFEILGSELTHKLPDPLNDQSHDIKGVATEFYDVYYSDVDGGFDIDGRYLTIAGAFGQSLPAGGGLNLAEIALNYEDNSVEYGSYVASFAALGDNAAPDSAPKSIDGDLQTHTTMGNNKNEPDQRLRVTLGFESSLKPG